MDHIPRPPYPKPPIIEAVIEVRVEACGDSSLVALEKVAPSGGEPYPTRRDFYHLTGEIQHQATTGISASAHRQQIGYQFVSDDERQIALCCHDRLAYSRLEPYQGWEALQSEAKRWWDSYREATRPGAITRIGVRSINRLRIPLPFDDFKDFILTAPEIAPGLPQALSGYFFRVNIPNDDEKTLIIIHEALEDPTDQGFISVILDIDAIREEAVPQDEPALWEAIDRLRHVKNRAFEASITNRMRKEFA